MAYGSSCAECNTQVATILPPLEDSRMEPIQMTATLLGKGGRMQLQLVRLSNSREQIIFDSLKTERPSWPFTCFGAPYFRPLISGDLSFEEYHLAALEANRNGTFNNWVCILLNDRLNPATRI